MTAAEKRATILEKLAAHISISAIEEDINGIDAAVAEIVAEQPGAIVVSKTRIREDGTETTTHYLCGDQRQSRERALLDLVAWRNLRNVHDSAQTWMAAAERLLPAGFSPDLAGLDALLAERRALWEALDQVVATLRGRDLASFSDASWFEIERRRDSSWLANHANREGGAG